MVGPKSAICRPLTFKEHFVAIGWVLPNSANDDLELRLGLCRGLPTAAAVAAAIVAIATVETTAATTGSNDRGGGVIFGGKSEVVPNPLRREVVLNH